MAEGVEPGDGLPGQFVAEFAPFVEALRRRVEQRQADGGHLAILLVDCGVVNRIDAVWGYEVGDTVRGRVTELLRTDVLRPGDFFGQMGRDSFACVLSIVEGPAVALLAAQKSLRALNAPFWIGDDEIFASPAIGIAIYPMHGDHAETLMQRAKSACDLAFDMTGRIADADDDRESRAEARLLHENRLRTAVSEDALELVFQPQYDLRRGQIMGTECLLRWNDPSLGVVVAEEAFAAAESAGMVTELVSSILNRALRNVSEFRYSGGLDLRIGIKLPSRALLDTELPDVVQRALGTWSRRPGTLILEIGGTSLLSKEPIAQETLLRLKEIGVKLSIDDPEMALSSLFWLATLPFQELKLDVSAVPDLAGASKSERILQSVVELAHALRLDVVAVGVADENQATRLKELGCDYMQADFKGPALDPQSFVERFGFSED
ncbi:MAG: EAL domain-containing protein [Polynucleobacter sp.]|nr:EAL domain-containing protein [Polynucleobacter sp.]